MGSSKCCAGAGHGPSNSFTFIERFKLLFTCLKVLSLDFKGSHFSVKTPPRNDGIGVQRKEARGRSGLHFL